MRIDFIKVNPVQNMTILVKSSHDRGLYREIAAKLMGYDSVCAEQVGFIEPVENRMALVRVQMMGGEFCGNAAMSMAAVIARDSGFRTGETRIIPLEVSGADRTLECEVTAAEQSYICKIEMPAPKEIKKVRFKVSGNAIEADLVRIPGISHIIIGAGDHSHDLESFAGEAMDSLPDLIEDEAFGLLFFNEEKLSMTPVVYVKDIGVPVWERSCASGTTAIGAYLALRTCGDVELAVDQPGGTSVVYTQSSGCAMRIWVKAEVKIAAEGTAFI